MTARDHRAIKLSVGRTFRAVLFALVWFSCAWFGSWEWNPNNSTRLFAAIGLVERGDATIDSFADLTIEGAVRGSFLPGQGAGDDADGVARRRGR